MKLELKNDCFELNLQVRDACGDCEGGDKGTISDASNPKNPFDEIGLAHNAGLDHLAKKYAGSIVIQDDLMLAGHVFEDDIMLRASLEFLQSYPFQNKEISKNLKEKADLYIKEIGQWDPRPSEIPFETTFPLDTIVATHDWLERLTLANVPGELLNASLGAMERGQATVQQFIDNVKKIEAAAIESELSEDDKNRVLAVASIARHSAAYWGAQSSAEKAAGPIGSDVKGAASGMAAGFITGVGIIVGGVLGGLTRSAAYLLAEKAIKA